MNSDKPAELRQRREAWVKTLTPNIVSAYGVYLGATAAVSTSTTNGEPRNTMSTRCPRRLPSTPVLP